MIDVSEEPSNLINRREYRKRYREFVAKHSDKIEELMKIPFENKVSWGTIIERNAEKFPENIAIKFEDKQLTYKEFNEWVNRYAHYFMSLDLKNSDVVEVMMRNRIEILLVFSAIAKIGAIASMINSDLREKLLIHSINLTPGKIIIIDEQCFEAFNNVKSNLNLTTDQILLFSPDKGLIQCPEGYIDLSEAVKGFPANNPPTTEKVKNSDPLAYIFTSGTTGLPKASTLIHHRMVGGSYLFGHFLTEITPDDTVYEPLPFFHSNALTNGWAAAFANGAALAISRKFSVTRFWDEVRKFDATSFNYIGEVCRYLMNQPPKPDDADNPVRAIFGNGLRPEIWKDFKKRFGITRVGEFYGASETPSVFANLLNFNNTVGYCSAPYVIVKFIADEEKPIRGENGFMQRVRPGEIGLLLFDRKDKKVFVGYTDKKATETKLFRNVFKHGDVWFNTGDLMRDQGCNHAQFVDRLGDTFRWKGHNISTTEVEEVLNVFEQVSMSTVYGVKIPGTDGRAGMAAILSRTKIEDFDFKGLANYLENNLPTYAVPIFLRFKIDISTTSTMKFKKSDLKKEGFDIETYKDPFYVLLPSESEYKPLTMDIYENIQNHKYKF